MLCIANRRSYRCSSQWSIGCFMGPTEHCSFHRRPRFTIISFIYCSLCYSYSSSQTQTSIATIVRQSLVILRSVRLYLRASFTVPLLSQWRSTTALNGSTFQLSRVPLFCEFLSLFQLLLALLLHRIVFIRIGFELARFLLAVAVRVVVVA